MSENLSLSVSMQPTVFRLHSENDHRHYQKVKAIGANASINGFFVF